MHTHRHWSKDCLLCFAFVTQPCARVKKMYILIHRQAMHLNFKRAKLHRRQETIYKCISYDFCRLGGYNLYRKEKKLRYFDHTCRSGILYTQYCVYFPIMSRSVSFRPHKYRALPSPSSQPPLLCTFPHI